jgi:hypothetical protein
MDRLREAINNSLPIYDTRRREAATDAIMALIADSADGAEVALDCGVMADAIAIYKPPFSFKAGYIYDSEGNMFADQGGTEDRAAQLARIRGWGRIGGMANPEELQDAVGKHMARALTEYWNKKRP